MSTNDEIQKLILEVQGRDKLAELNRELEKEQKALQELAEQLRQGQVAQQQFDQAAAKSAGEVLRLRQEIKNLAGSGGGAGGQGILGASYAVQDFVSVLSGGQGLDRALMSVQNNIPQIVMGLGAGQGLAGVVSLVSMGIGALIPLVEKLWKSLGDGEAAGQAKERLQELRSELEAAHKEFQDLANAPTDPERESARGVRMVLSERPNAAKARAAVAGAVARGNLNLEDLPPEMQDAIKKAHPEAMRSDKDLAGQAESEVPRVDADQGFTFEMRQKAVADAIEELKRQRQVSRAGAGETAGELLIRGAQRAGPAGEDARRLLLGAAGDQVPDLRAVTPEALARAEEEYQEYEESGGPGTEAFANRARKGSRAFRQHRRERARLKSSQTDAILSRHADEIRDEQKAEAQEAADADRELERSNNAYIRGKPARQKRERFDQARGLARQAAASQGFHEGNGNAPSAQELDQMAAMTLQGMKDGLGGHDAAMQALYQKLQQIQATMQQFQQMQQNMLGRDNRLMMGPDNSGNFPLLTPYF